MRKTAILIFIAFSIVAAGLSGGQAGDSRAKPASTALTEYVKAFNTGDPAAMRAFFASRYAASALKETSVEERVNRYPATKNRLQSLDVGKILAEREFQTFALVKAGNGQDFLLRAEVEKESPYGILFIFFDVVEDPDNIVLPDPQKDEAALASTARSWLEARTKADEFSGVALIARNGRILFHEAFGFADRERKIPNRKDTKFNLGSINKSFTRMAVLQLEKQGKLSLQDPIKKFLPDYPNAEAAGKVTIAHLLNMTSGIGDFFGPRYDATPKAKIRGLGDYLPLFADRPLEFEPGANNRYSNGGFIVLGLIIEKASGMSYYDYVRENVFKPAGMADTDSWAADENVPNRVLGYTRDGRPGNARVVNERTLPGRGSSAGGGYSTAADMLKYVEALRTGKLFLPDIRNGMGIAGGAPGISAGLEWDPRSGYVVIVLTNFDPPAADDAVRKIVSWLPEQGGSR